jgi:hypothetical protein
MLLGAAFMYGAVTLPLVGPGLLGIAAFFVCIAGTWFVWFKMLPIDCALLAGGVTMGGVATAVFVWEILIGETMLANLILSLEASLFVIQGLIASIVTLCRHTRASAVATTILNVGVFGYGIWLWGWGSIPAGGYGP